jgi:hypothetical protein
MDRAGIGGPNVGFAEEKEEPSSCGFHLQAETIWDWKEETPLPFAA